MKHFVRSLLASAAMAAVIAGGQAAAEEPVRGGTLVSVMGSNPRSLNGAVQSGIVTGYPAAQLFASPLSYDEDGTPQPYLAESWEISDDGLTYTFTLRSGVTFHDGTTMDAEDVKFSLDRILAEDSANAQKALYAAIYAVEVIDPLTVQLTLSEPNGNMLFNLAWGAAVIVAPQSIHGIKPQPICTGAFKLASCVPSDPPQLSRNDAYCGTPPPLAPSTSQLLPTPPPLFRPLDRKSTRLNSSHVRPPRMPSSA